MCDVFDECVEFGVVCVMCLMCAGLVCGEVRVMCLMCVCGVWCSVSVVFHVCVVCGVVCVICLMCVWFEV